MIELIKKIVPDKYKKIYHKRKQKQTAKYVASLPKLCEQGLKEILIDRLGISSGDMVFVHSSLGMLNLDFPSYHALPIILDIIGSEGTLIMPTYPKESSYNFLKNGKVFDIKKTPTYTGLLNEYARRHSAAVRSLHPTKSVVAIGKYAHEITCDHHKGILPYHSGSPYYKINAYNAKVIGIGVQTTYLSAVHSVDDTFPQFPVETYHNEIFEAKCINYERQEVIVKTKAHDMRKMHFDLPKFFAQNVDKSICEDIDIDGMKFFRANAKELYDELCKLAGKGITIYSKKFYGKK